MTTRCPSASARRRSESGFISLGTASALAPLHAGLCRCQSRSSSSSRYQASDCHNGRVGAERVQYLNVHGACHHAREDAAMSLLCLVVFSNGDGFEEVDSNLREAERGGVQSGVGQVCHDLRFCYGSSLSADHARMSVSFYRCTAPQNPVLLPDVTARAQRLHVPVFGVCR